MSAQEWRDLARSMFEELGADEILNAVLKVPGDVKVYDREAGRFTTVPGEVPVKMFIYEQTSKLTNPHLWIAGDIMVMMGTYDLTIRIPNGVEVSWDDPVTGDPALATIVQTKAEDGGIGAFSYVHMRGLGGGV